MRYRIIGESDPCFPSFRWNSTTRVDSWLLRDEGRQRRTWRRRSLVIDAKPTSRVSLGYRIGGQLLIKEEKTSERTQQQNRRQPLINLPHIFQRGLYSRHSRHHTQICVYFAKGIPSRWASRCLTLRRPSHGRLFRNTKSFCGSPALRPTLLVNAVFSSRLECLRKRCLCTVTHHASRHKARKRQCESQFFLPLPTTATTSMNDLCSSMKKR